MLPLMKMGRKPVTLLHQKAVVAFWKEENFVRSPNFQQSRICIPKPIGENCCYVITQAQEARFRASERRLMFCLILDRCLLHFLAESVVFFLQKETFLEIED